MVGVSSINYQSLSGPIQTATEASVVSEDLGRLNFCSECIRTVARLELCQFSYSTWKRWIIDQLIWI